MTDAVVVGFIFPTHCTHIYKNTHMAAGARMHTAANPPIGAKLKSTGWTGVVDVSGRAQKAVALR